MTPEMRSALAELGFAWSEVQSSAARYEHEHTMGAASDLARRLNRVVSQVGVVKQALRADVLVEPAMPVVVTDGMVGRALCEYQDLPADVAQGVLELALGLRQAKARDAA